MDIVYQPNPIEQMLYWLSDMFYYTHIPPLFIIALTIIIPLLVGIYIYHDAEQHNTDNALIWAILAFLCWPIVLVIYLIHKQTKQKQGGIQIMSLAKRGYFFIMSLMTILILYWAIADFFRLIFNPPSSGSSWLLSDYRQGLSLRISTVIVALPLWIFHWLKASALPESTLNAVSRTSVLKSQRAYTLIIMVIFGLLFLAFGTALIHLLISLLLGVDVNTEDLGAPLGYGILAGLAWFYHYHEFQNVTQNLHKSEQESSQAQVPMTGQ